MTRGIFSNVLAGLSSMLAFAHPWQLDLFMRVPSTGRPLPGKKGSNATTRRSATKRRNITKRLSKRR